MTITYKVEPFSGFIKEAAPLLENHWEEVALYKDKVELDPDYEKYEQLEKLGVLHCVTVRDGKKLVGYFITFIQPHLHYKDTVYGINDILYLDPEYRGGSTATKLFLFAEEKLKEEGVDVIVLHSKVHVPFDNLAKFLKYDLAETTLSKYVGD